MAGLKTLYENVLLRRVITIPVAITLALLMIVLSPLWIPLAWIVGLINPAASGALRCLCFVTIYLCCSTIGIVRSELALVWHTLIGANEKTRRAANYRIQHWWANSLKNMAARLFRLNFIIEGKEALEGDGALILPRHTSIGDTVLPFCFYAIPCGKTLRYVLKRELLLDPALDIVGNRIPNYFIDRVSDNMETELARMKMLTHDLSADEGMVIYLEGTRFSEIKRQRVLDLYRERGNTAALARFEKMTHVLPPRPTGTLALMEATPDRDIVFMAHTGFEGSASFASLLDGGWLDTDVRIRFWRVPAAEIPREREAARVWLNDQWQIMNDVVAELAARSA